MYVQAYAILCWFENNVFEWEDEGQKEGLNREERRWSQKVEG